MKYQPTRNWSHKYAFALPIGTRVHVWSQRGARYMGEAIIASKERPYTDKIIHLEYTRFATLPRHASYPARSHFNKFTADYRLTPLDNPIR